ncbi:MAG: hypothetical protein N2691_05625 [Patescibacteria group bacterium]|nr:hypothetical protein [Patescibacteria group bacterium]
MEKVSLAKLSRAAFPLLTIFMYLLTPIGQMLIPTAHAAFSAASLTVSDSRAGASGVTYTTDGTPSASTPIQRYRIDFCTTASGSCTVPSGLNTTGAALSADTIEGATPTTDFTTNGTVIINIVGNSVSETGQTGVTLTGITNPTTINTTYFARITSFSDAGTTVIDTSTVAFAILDTTSIAVTASVDPTLTFTVTGVSSGSTVNGATTDVTTTATTVPFGTLSSGDPSIAAHDLTVVTNAVNGYTITVRGLTAPVLQAGSENIDEFTGTNASPVNWSAPSGTTASVNTGYFGYTTNDSTLGTGTANRFTNSGPNWAGTTTTAAEVAYSPTGVTTETTRIGWRAEVNGLQPAGAYSGTVVLVATPTY